MSTKTTATASAAAKKITVQGTAGTRHAEYNPISDSYLRANPKAVLTALIHGMNAHCADMLITMLDIMADKYGHEVNDLIDTVKGDDRWKAVTEHPVLNSLGYFDQEDADRVIGKKSAAATTAEDLHDTVKPAKVAKPAAKEEEAAPAPKAKKATKKTVATEEVKETITHAEAYGYGGADITPGEVTIVEEAPTPVKAKKSSSKKATAEETSVAEEAAAPAPVKAKKASSKKATAEEPPAVAEETPAPAKKTTKKKAAATDDAVEAITESVAKLTTEEVAPAPTKKKVVSKKPVKSA